MKKALKRTLIAAAALTGISLLAAAVFMGRELYEGSQMSPVKTGEILPGIFAVNSGMVDFFIVRTDEGLIAVDAGRNPGKTEKELASLGLDPNEVGAVFLTHTDSDHTAALGLFPKARVYLSKDEVQMVDGTTARQGIMHNSLNRQYTALRDGETVTADGMTVELRSTPGHTPGSASWLVDGKYLFTGDLCSIRNGEIDVFNRYYNMDTELEKKSIALIPSFGARYLFTGHYGWKKL